MDQSPNLVETIGGKDVFYAESSLVTSLSALKTAQF